MSHSLVTTTRPVISSGGGATGCVEAIVSVPATAYCPSIAQREAANTARVLRWVEAVQDLQLERTAVSPRTRRFAPQDRGKDKEGRTQDPRIRGSLSNRIETGAG